METLTFDPAEITPNELRAVKKLSGKGMAEIFNPDGGGMDEDAFQALGAIAIKRSEPELSWEDAYEKAGDLPISFLAGTPSEELEAKTK